MASAPAPSVQPRYSLPGPADYSPTDPLAKPPQGGRFSTSQLKGPMAMLGEVQDERTPCEIKLPEFGEDASGGRVVMRRGKTFLDWAIYRAKREPGPADTAPQRDWDAGITQAGATRPGLLAMLGLGSAAALAAAETSCLPSGETQSAQRGATSHARPQRLQKFHPSSSTRG